MEIVSESTRRRDMLVKRDLYRKAGVREYWVVDTGRVYKYVLVEGGYRETVYVAGDTGLELDVSVLPSCVLKMYP
jgi:Uma2 family endonuclease